MEVGGLQLEGTLGFRFGSPLTWGPIPFLSSSSCCPSKNEQESEFLPLFCQGWDKSELPMHFTLLLVGLQEDLRKEALELY